MAWFRRSRRRPYLGSFVAPEARPPASLADLVEEGELISAAAVRLAIKNQIITGSLRDQLAFDDDRYRAAVVSEVLALARERDDDADRIALDRTDAEGRTGSAQTFHDYRRADAATLVRREDYSRRLAVRLRELAHDEEFARTTVARAREAAWDEIAASVQARLTRAATIADEPDYVIDRIDRLRDLTRDLRRLERGQ
jgi:hypothetical protein